MLKTLKECKIQKITHCYKEGDENIFQTTNIDEYIADFLDTEDINELKSKVIALDEAQLGNLKYETRIIIRNARKKVERKTMEGSMFRNVPCEKCLANTVDSNSDHKVKPDDVMFNSALCPSCQKAIALLLQIINWLGENHNERRICLFNYREDSRYAEFKIDRCYIKFDSLGM